MAFLAAPRKFFARPASVRELALLAALLSAGIVIITAVGGAKLLADEGSEALPVVYILLSIVSIPLASAIAVALGRWPTAPVCRVLCLLAAGLSLLMRIATELAVPGIAQSICILAYSLEIVFDTLFWLTVSEYLPTREMKRHAPFLTAAFGIGGVGGGLLATAQCVYFSADNLLIMGAVVFLLCVFQYVRIPCKLKSIGSWSDEDEEVGVKEAFDSTFRVVRSFPISGAISLGIFLMAALFCLQDYLAMTIFGETFADEDELAGFIALAYSGYQVLELVLVIAIGGLVLERASPLARNLIFPVSTLTCLGVLAFNWTLWVGVLLHANANAVSNAVFESVKTLNYAAIPYRVLAPVRMMVEGMVYPLGIAISGVSLMVLQPYLDPKSILLVALALAAGFVVASAVVGVSFLPSLINSLRVRAIMPSDYLKNGLRQPFARADIGRLLQHADPEARLFGQDLARVLAPDLAQERQAPPNGVVGAAEAAADGTAHWRLLSLSLSPTGHIRANDEGATLEQFPQGTFSDPEPYGAAASLPALGCTNPAAGPLRARLLDASFLPAASFAQEPRRGLAGTLVRRLAALLSREHRRKRSQKLERLGQRLEARNGQVRRQAARRLGAVGRGATGVAARRLHSSRPEVVEAALRALAAIGTLRARRLLRQHLRPAYARVRLNLKALAALDAVQANGVPRSLTVEVLENWLTDNNNNILRRVMAAKSALSRSRDVNLLNWLVRAQEIQVRSNAVEALTSMSTGNLIRPLLPLLEEGAETEKDRARASPSETDVVHLFRMVAECGPWVALITQRFLQEDLKLLNMPRSEIQRSDEAMLDQILFLKSVTLFRVISFEDLARVAEVAINRTYAAGDTIVSTGQAMTHIYLLQEGEAALFVGEVRVETLRIGASYGDLALAGGQASLNTVRATTDVRMLVVPISLIEDLVAEYPDALAPVVAECLSRIKALQARVAALSISVGV